MQRFSFVFHFEKEIGFCYKFFVTLVQRKQFPAWID